MSDFHSSLDRALNPLADPAGVWCDTCDTRVGDRHANGEVTIKACPVCPDEPTC